MSGNRIDLAKSFLRSGLKAASKKLGELPVTKAVQRALQNVKLGRLTIGDAELTAAVARGRGVTAATVSTKSPRIHVDAAYEDGGELSVAFSIAPFLFAPGGAKELRFVVSPAEAAGDGRAREAFAAIAGAIARRLWAPALGPTPDPGHSAFVEREGAQLAIDLRTVPAVRSALSRRTTLAMIEVLKPRALTAGDGGIDLILGFEGLGA